MKIAIFASLLAMAYCQEPIEPLVEHCKKSMPEKPTMHDDYVFTICCMNTPGHDLEARTNCVKWLYDNVGPFAPLAPTEAQISSQFGYTGWHNAIVNGAIKLPQRDTQGNYYLGPTNALNGEIEYQMGEIPPVNAWKPLDVLECYLLRPVDKATYKEMKVTLKPGDATSSEEPIVLSVEYGGNKQTMPLAANVASDFTFSQAIDMMAVTNTDHYDLLVLANVQVPFVSQPGDAENRIQYCTNNATLGKNPYPTDDKSHIEL
jgi:hypothetical protein